MFELQLRTIVSLCESAALPGQAAVVDAALAHQHLGVCIQAFPRSLLPNHRSQQDM